MPKVLALDVHLTSRKEKDDDLSEDTDVEPARDEEEALGKEWMEEDSWDTLDQVVLRHPDVLVEVSSTNVHIASRQFEHGATPMPACYDDIDGRWDRANTLKFRAMHIRLPVNCTKCIQIREEKGLGKTQAQLTHTQPGEQTSWSSSSSGSAMKVFGQE